MDIPDMMGSQHFKQYSLYNQPVIPGNVVGTSFSIDSF